MRTVLLAALFALALPLFASAAISAGFPSSALWLSKSTVYAGDSVTISTALYNSSTSTVQGTVEFLVDGSRIGSSDFTLDSGKSTILSTDWLASAGHHALAARIVGGSTFASAETSVLSIAVTAPPPPPVQVSLPVKTASSVASVVDSVIGTSTPAVSAAVQKTVELTEAVRNGIANYAQKELAASAAKKPSPSPVLRASSSTADSGYSGYVATAWQMAMSLLLTISKSVALFYPVFAFLILFLLYLAFKTLRRPSRY